jgi:hypothetical protein
VWAAVLALAIAGPGALPVLDAHAATAQTTTVQGAEREATFREVADGWATVQRYRSAGDYPAEVYPPDGRGDQVGETARFFGAARPHSSQFLLYSAPAPSAPAPSDPASSAAARTPVLLVHGANQTAGQAWANPNSGGSFGCGVVLCPSTGLMQRLVADGHHVFAIGFPHRNGDGRYWAQQIGDAVDLVRERTGAPAVDVVGWSKGAFNARMYVSSIRPDWGRRYAGGIGKLVLLGNPSLGFDWGYRHGISLDPVIWPECGGTLNAPAAHTTMTCFGLRTSHPELSYEGSEAGNAFPGSGQMLARWDKTYPLPVYEQDWYTTYYGGTGFFSAGRGIQYVIDRQSLVEPILDAGTPAGLPVYLLCGAAPTMAGLHNEHTGPSDGAVFVASCTSTRGIGTLGGRSTQRLNHLQLGWARPATDRILRWLR